MVRVLVHLSLDSPEAVEGTCDQRRLRSDCADAQADLSLRWSHKLYCRFCHALTQLCEQRRIQTRIFAIRYQNLRYASEFLLFAIHHLKIPNILWMNCADSGSLRACAGVLGTFSDRICCKVPHTGLRLIHQFYMKRQILRLFSDKMVIK